MYKTTLFIVNEKNALENFSKACQKTELHYTRVSSKDDSILQFAVRYNFPGQLFILGIFFQLQEIKNQSK